MFSLREFVMKTIKGMIGEEPDYKVRKYALGWYEKEVLTEEDMIEIEMLIEAQYATDEEVTEEVTETE
ncbi:MAG: hypothetical protein E7290_09300 [Lachnospiraceae bacterium]|nr:hypothetical protein [Lachnospiraceae bacterium]